MIASAAWRAVVACSDGASSSPPSLKSASAKLISSQGQFLDGRKRRWKHKHGHRLGLLAGLLIPYSPLLPPQSSPWPPGNLCMTPTPFVTAPPTNVCLPHPLSRHRTFTLPHFHSSRTVTRVIVSRQSHLPRIIIAVFEHHKCQKTRVDKSSSPILPHHFCKRFPPQQSGCVPLNW